MRDEVMDGGVGDEPGEKLFDVVEELGTIGIVFGVPVAHLIGAVLGHEAARLSHGRSA
jgi:hypothetical protein